MLYFPVTGRDNKRPPIGGNAMKEESIVFIGGDMRMVYAAKKLSMRHRCALSGFGSLETGLPSVAAGARYSAAVLPIFAGGAREIRCPFANKAYDINILTLHLDRGSVVFAGKVFPELEKLCAENGYTLYDYLAREELAVLNAELTAEGAVSLAISETSRALLGSKAAVLGFGRIAKLCARYLAALGAVVTVCARKKRDLAWAAALGYGNADINDEAELRGVLAEADIVMNTVPAKIITPERAAAIKKDALLIELASVPCTDGEPPFRIISAGGLPGKTAPVSAGEIIADTIVNILTERSDKNGGA